MHRRSKHWHLLYYVIMKPCDIRDVQITRAMRGAECWTDHCMIMAKVLMRVRPPMRKRGRNGRHLACACLEDTTAISEFRHSLAEKLGELELCLNGENSTDQQWIFISAALYEAIVQTIGYKSRNYQDWFDNNSNTIHNLLNNITDTKHVRIP